MADDTPPVTPPTTKTITIAITGPADSIDRALLKFVTAYGYPLTVKDANGNDIPNTASQTDFAAAPVWQYFMGIVESQELKDAQVGVTQSVQSQVSTAASAMTLSLNVA